MGVIGQIWTLLFGGERNVVAETVEVFRENSEKSAVRAVQTQSQALSQFSQEFQPNKTSWFDSLINGLNRLPRPMMALGVMGLFGSAMYDPIWFSKRMQGLILVPEPLWWLMGAVVSFYFGARYQVKNQEFQQVIASSLQRTEHVRSNLKSLDARDRREDHSVSTVSVKEEWGVLDTQNAALKDWQEQK